MGSSIPYWAGESAARRPGGRNLNLPLDIVWRCFRGLKWDALDKLIDQELKHSPPPDMLLIHLGSNDLTAKDNTAVKFFREIQCSLYRYNVLLPSTKLIWSSLLPRLFWWGAPPGCGGKIDKKRKKVNKAVKKCIFELQGAYINHDLNISVAHPNLFRQDGTHLSHVGNLAYLNNIQGGLSFILRNEGNEFPPPLPNSVTV